MTGHTWLDALFVASLAWIACALILVRLHHALRVGADRAHRRDDAADLGGSVRVLHMEMRK